MRERKTGNPGPTPWHVPVAVEDIPEDGRHFALVADLAIRAELARMAKVRDLPRLEASFDVTRHSSGGLHVVGHVSATVGQNCVVTLEPLANEIEEDIDLLFLPQADVAQPAEHADGLDAPVDSEPDPLIDGVADLGALATEFLFLGIDPYPRKPGATFDAPADDAPADSPFAALAGLAKGRHGN